MTHVRTEDDLRDLFAEDARDVSGAAELLARLAPEQRPRRRWLPALVAAGAVATIAVVVVLAQGGTSSPPPAPGTGVPADWRTVSYPDRHMTLQAPPTWHSYRYADDVSNFSALIGYLTAQPAHDPCVVTATSKSCDLPVSRLAANGVLVSWRMISSAGGRLPVSGPPGEQTSIGGHAADVRVAAPDRFCASIGARQLVDAVIGASRSPDSNVRYEMRACLGPEDTAANRTSVLTMLRTVHLSRQVPAATVDGRLLAVGGPAGLGPRPMSGTVTLTGRDGETTVSAGVDGRYSALVPPGRYELTGHSPAYGNGSYLCHAGGPVTAPGTGHVNADVYCQER